MNGPNKKPYKYKTYQRKDSKQIEDPITKVASNTRTRTISPALSKSRQNKMCFLSKEK